MNKRKYISIPVLYAVAAALLFGSSVPFSKMLLRDISPLLMASLLYFGAGAGMALIGFRSVIRSNGEKEASLGKKQLPYILGMIMLDIAAPILMMFGLTLTTAETASLLVNFEVAATAFIAMIFFRESIGGRLAVSILLITLASIFLSFSDISTLSFSGGAAMVLLACVCWGLENNCTRMLSLQNPVQIVVIKGLCVGLTTLILAFASGQCSAPPHLIPVALMVGLLGYGLSIFFYVLAQRELGAARTGAYYAAAPFIGAILSFVILKDPLTVSFAAAFAVMLAGVWLAISEKHRHAHLHEALEHEHRHRHSDEHHGHHHDGSIEQEHSHRHTHAEMKHNHAHTPDLHHLHRH